MSEYIVTIPKKALKPDIMELEYNPLQHQDETNSGLSMLIMRTHTYLKKMTYQPCKFSGQKGKQTFYFFSAWIAIWSKLPSFR